MMNERLVKESGNLTADKMVLGNNVESAFDSAVTKLNNNTIVLGTTGSGKSMSITEPQIMHTYNNNLVVTMTKRKMADTYADLMKSRGYRVRILDLTRPDDSTAGFDPLFYMKEETDIVSVAKSIVYASKNQASGRDPYWEEAAVSLISAEIAALVESWVYAQETGSNDSPEPTLENLLELHKRLKFVETDRCGMTESTLDNLFQRLEKENPVSYAVQCWNAVKGIPYRTVSCILSTVNVAYSQIFTPNIREIAVKRPLDIEKLGSEKTVLFIITSPVDKSANNFVNMIYSTMFKVLFKFAEEQKDYRLPVPVHFICDDFACGSVIPDFAEYISVIRATGISVTLLVQSETQFEKLYGSADAVTIFNNCDRTVYFGGTDINTCNSIAKRANVPFDDIYNMPLEKVYVFQRGSKAVLTDRYHTMDDPVWQMIHDKEISREREKA